MARYYSRTTGCTYLDDVHRNMPDDVIPIDEERYLSVIGNPAPGKIRGHDVQGLPILVDPSPQTLIERCEALYQERSAAINLACESAITSGFLSDALGASYTYSSKIDDQLNLTGAILGGSDTPFACTDEQGMKAFQLHTAAQLRQVWDDFSQFKLQLLQKANELKQELDRALAATDLAALEAVTWEGQPS
jgi:hypothetical protein